MEDAESIVLISLVYKPKNPYAAMSMDLSKLSAGNLPGEINVVVEIPQGSSIKYELDKESGALIVDRFLHTAMVYPFNYGFIPHTKAADGDPVDVLLVSAQPVTPGAVVNARPVGLLEMEDEAGSDTKIIAVPTKNVDPWYAKIEDIGDLDEATHEKIRHFFSHYKELEQDKWVEVKHMLGRDEAYRAIQSATETH